MKYISEQSPADEDNLEGRTFALECGGVVGNMVFLTDLDFNAVSGHNIVEVEIFGRG